jgi:predicted small lipoprotein YifL
MISDFILSRIPKVAALSAAAVILCACGQRGPLIQPDKNAATGKNNAANPQKNVPESVIAPPATNMPVPVTP